MVEVLGATKNQFVSSVACRLNKKTDSVIIAVYDRPNGEVEFFTNIINAWQLNWTTKRLDQISAKGVDCMNPGYGVDTN